MMRAKVHPYFCRDWLEKPVRLSYRDECTCDRAAVAYTRSA